ncbi:hypothetical protein N9L47_02880 [Rhodobacteraceae bacterium]|nr:hypothetical protein [Paracoccaceae bacterium]
MFRILLLIALMAGAMAHANSDNIIPYRKEVALKVGQAVIVNGFRGDCGERPKNVDPKRTRATKLGVLTIGKWGMTKSRNCGGLTPAVEVIYHAKTKGSETIEVNGSKIRVTVK